MSQQSTMKSDSGQESLPGNTTTASVSTTYMVRDNSKLERFGQERSERSFAALAEGARDYEGARAQIQSCYDLKARIREQHREIERLNSESNDLVLKIVQYVRDRDDLLYSIQLAATEVAEQRLMLARLLAAVREVAAVGGNGGGDAGGAPQGDEPSMASAQQFRNMTGARPGGVGGGYSRFPQYGAGMTKNMAIGLMGRLDRQKEAGDLLSDCRQCARSKATQGCPIDAARTGKSASGSGGKKKLSGGGDKPGDNDGDGDSGAVDTTVSAAELRLEALRARVKSLCFERDGMTALLTRRLQNLDASLLRFKATLSERMGEAERLREAAGREAGLAARLLGDLEVRRMQLESDAALLAAKGQSTAKAAQERRKDAQRAANREIKIFLQKKQERLEQLGAAGAEAHQADMRRLRETLLAKDRRAFELGQRLDVLRGRCAKQEVRVRALGDRNARMREAISEFYAGNRAGVMASDQQATSDINLEVEAPEVEEEVDE